MWFLPLLISVVLVATLWVFQRQDSLRSKRARIRYYRRHCGLLEDLDRIRKGLILVYARVQDGNSNRPAFMEYEKLVTDFERLLVSIRSLPLASPNLNLLKSADLLADSLRMRLAAIDRTLDQMKPLKGKSLQTKSMQGCYFCSKPSVTEPLKRIRIKIDSELKQVLGCSACREAVKSNRSAKVLFFSKEGKSLHWSESPDYRPDEAYFLINSPLSKELGRSQLRLVYSTSDESAEMRE